MPAEWEIHEADCPIRDGQECKCVPHVEVVANPMEARKVKELSGGDSKRVRFRRLVPPLPVNNVSAHRSQAARHGREISN